MTAPTPIRMPAAFAAGTQVVYRRTYADQPANDGWTMKVYLAGKDVIAGGIAAAADGADFVVTITAAATAAFRPGLYEWSEVLTKASVPVEGERGEVLLSRNLATAAAGEAESDAEKELAAIRAEILERVTSGIDSWSLEAEGVQKIPLEELRKREKELMRRIARRRGSSSLFASMTRLHARRPGCGS